MKRRVEEGVVQPSRRYEKKGDVFFALMYKIKSVSNTEFSIETHFVAKNLLKLDSNRQTAQKNKICQDKTILKRQIIFLSLSLESAFSKYKG